MEPKRLELLRYDRATTDPEIAIDNFNGSIESLERLMQREPSDWVYGQQLAALKLARTQYLGTYSDFEHVDAITQALLAAHAQSAEAHKLRAGYLSSIHLFEAAEEQLSQAQPGEDGANLDLSTYDIARGIHLQEAYALRQARAEADRSYKSLTDLAVAAAALGRYEEADQHYRDALYAYRDVSPLPVAWVYFQRGVLWGEMANRADLARALYAEAVRLLPAYVVANIHLAEREYADGDEEQALARLERIQATTEDPEPSSRLAQYLEEADPEAAASFREQARSGYDRLLGAHGRAFLDHASEFFANAGGDPKRALALALQNLDHRQNGRAYQIALQAAAAAGDERNLCRLWAEAKEAAQRHANLSALRDHLGMRCRD